MKILIAAQYYRTGSTLVQRCLHACENTKIYGEMNSLLSAGLILEKMSVIPEKTVSGDKARLDKKSNWYDKIDDDYSMCIPHERLANMYFSMPHYVLGIQKDSMENIGFKCIGPTSEELHFAARLGFKIIWLTRDLKEATNSYLSQPWNHGIEMWANVKRRSDSVTPKFLEFLQDKEKAAAEVYKLDYSEIHEKIGEIIETMGLRIEEEKLQAILANKVNSGY